MRLGLVLLTALAFATLLPGQAAKESDPGRRYGYDADLATYPQKTPQETLGSVLKAIENKRIAYLMAQLAEPGYVDERVQKVHAGKFDGLVNETTEKVARDPGVIRKMRRYLSDGMWDTQGNSASAQIKAVPERVFFKKIGNRWFFENKNRPDAQPKEK
jgi:hypothetical protein